MEVARTEYPSSSPRRSSYWTGWSFLFFIVLFQKIFDSLIADCFIKIGFTEEVEQNIEFPKKYQWFQKLFNDNKYKKLIKED